MIELTLGSYGHHKRKNNGIVYDFQTDFKSSFSFNQGRLFYYSPQMLGNNFFILGKNSKFWNKKKGGKEISEEIRKKRNKKFL